MNTSFVPTTIRVVQRSTKRVFALTATTADHWAGQWPTKRVGDVLVTEYPGSADGSLFVYWLGDKTTESPGVVEAIEAHLDDHDVVGTRVIFGFPDEVHPSLKRDLKQLKASANAARGFQTAISDV